MWSLLLWLLGGIIFVFAIGVILGFVYFILQGIIMGIGYIFSEIFDPID